MTKNEISNLAISNIGITTTIIDIDTEKSIEARKCRLYFPIALKESLEECRYGSTAVFKALALVSTYPNTEWRYAYRYPADCVFISRIMRFAGSMPNSYPFMNGQNDVSYREAHDDVHGRIIYTDEANAFAEYYIMKESNMKMSAKFWLGLSFRLAQYIAPSLAKSDATKIVDKMKYEARILFQQAQAKNWNEQKFDEEDPRSSLERSRQGY